MKNKIFISYSEFDKSKVKILEDKLNLRAYFEPVIIAKRKEPLKPLATKVKEGILESQYFIPIITRKSIITQWINQEIGFATSVNSIKIIPIVESKLITKLKGFINKEVDLPYTFKGNLKSASSENKSFSKVVEDLISRISDEIVQEIKTTKNPSDIFTGKWINQYTLENQPPFNEHFEIVNNKYIIDGKHFYNIENFKYDKDNRTISFKKVGVGADSRIFEDNLKIINQYRFEGEEIFKNNNTKIIVAYTKIT